MQLCCSKTIMTSKSPLLTLIVAAGGGPAQEHHDRRHLNPKECLTFKGIQATMVMTSLGTFSGLLIDQ